MILRSCLLLCAILVITFGMNSVAYSQALDISQSPTLQRLTQQLIDNEQKATEMLIEIGGIISPSGKEHERAEAVRTHMERIGLKQVRVDSGPNAIGILEGQTDQVLVFISTLDDLAGVAENQLKSGKKPFVQDNKVMGPGTNTSSITVSMLLAAEALANSGIKPYYTLVFAAVAQEETGLQGMKKLFEEYSDAVGYVDILGDGRSISYGAIGIHWHKIQVQGPPGHSLGGGIPNVNQAIGRAVDRILGIEITPRYKEFSTIINVGMIQSGNVFNHKPAEGWFSLDIRSMDGGIISEIEQKVDDIIKAVANETGLSLRMEPFQITPGGQVPGALESELVQLSISISRMLGNEPNLSQRGSSNMNVALGAGKLAVGLGGERGGRRGFEDEWADIDAMMRTAVHVMLLGALMGSM